MGVIIYPSGIGTKVRSMNQNLQRLDENAAIQEKRLTEISSDIGLILKGRAWNTVRDYVCNVQLPLMKTYRLWIEEQRSANDAYKRAADDLPRVSVLDEDRLEEQLAYWERRLSREQNREHPSRSVIRRCRNMIGDIRTKLRAIRRFVSVTNHIYDRPDSILNILGKTNEKLNSVHYNPQEQSIQFGAVSNSWLLELQNAKDNLPEKVNEQYIDGSEVTIEEYVVLLLSEDGRKTAVDLIRKNELSDKEYQALAIALLETEDKDMLEAVLNGCYEHKATVGPIQEGGGVSTINVIYEKNGKLNILIKHMEQMSGAVVKEYAELTPTDRSVMKTMFLNAMQYEPLLKELKGMGDNLVVSTHQSTFSPDAFTKPIDGKLISVICGEDGKIQVSWCEADKENGKLPYDQQTLHSVAVSRPSAGSGAWTMVETEGFQYIKSELGLGFGVDDGAGIAVDGAMGVTGLVSIPVSIASIIKGIAGSITGSFNEEKVYDKGVDIAKQGSVLNMFNLYCVSSVVEEREKEVGRNYSLYPSYQELDSAQISTQECIDNFNKNFGEEGIFYEVGNKLEFTKPLSMETLLSEVGFKEVTIIVGNWTNYTEVSGINADDAVEALSEQGE